MEFEDINPIAVVFGIAGAVIGIIIIKSMGGANLGGVEYSVGLFWKILIPPACGVVCYFMVDRMSQR